MKRIFAWIGNFFAVALAALAGNWLGGQIRFYLTGELPQTIQFKYTTEKGRTITNSPVATKLYPAMFFAFVGKPRWLFALIGGLLAGGFMPDEFENYWVEKVIEPLIVDRALGD